MANIQTVKTVGMSPVGFVILAGVIAYIGSVKEFDGPFPPNTVRVISGTAVLAILVSLVQNSTIRQPVKWAAILLLLSSAIRYVPAFSVKKGKK